MRISKKLWPLMNRSYPIGVDMGDDALKLVQLMDNGSNMTLVAGGTKNRSMDVKPGSSNWQRWAIETIRELTANGNFHSRDIVAAMPASEVFIDHLKMPKITDSVQKKHTNNPEHKLAEALLPMIRQKLPFQADRALIKYIPAEEDNVLAIATEREKIDRHLAIYEKANLRIKSIGVWPVALANTYTRFFGRRKNDIEAIVMLLDVEPNRTNTVICRHKNLLFARSIPIGAKQLADSGESNQKRLGAGPICETLQVETRPQADEMIARLVAELTTCKRCFSSMNKKTRIQRLIFLSGHALDRSICETIARQLELPAQIGDCLAAVEMPDPYGSGIDRRGAQCNWATAFGLSLA